MFTEKALAGLELSKPNSWEPIIATLRNDYAPISDMRASADYRLDVAQSLLRKALIEISETSKSTRVVGQRGKAA